MQYLSRTIMPLLFLFAGPALAQVSVHDYLGRHVELAAPATRIVSLMPSHTETVLALGAGELLVGVDEVSQALPGSGLPNVGNGFQPNIELIMSLDPDLVLTDKFTGIHEQLQELGLTTFAGTPETVGQVLAFNAVAGTLLGRGSEARELTDRQQTAIDAAHEITTGLQQPTVYVELDPTPFSAGPGSYVDELLKLSGAVNVVPAEMGAWPMLSPEFVVASDPDVVLLLDAPFGESEESFRSRPGFDGLAGRVIEVQAMPADQLSRPGPGLIPALQWLISQLHPGVSAE